ncbi:hypothetical protein DFJ74DRAFT_447847 [Hyaloraphidium curvatum]|nr:hypothetical protein DFJ74DRAFT_447847 [Hyaloraphidium curvatum]
MAVLTPIIEFLQAHIPHTLLVLIVLLVAVATRAFILYANLLGPNYASARVARVDGLSAEDLLRKLRALEGWEGAEVVEWRPEEFAEPAKDEGDQTPAELTRRALSGTKRGTKKDKPANDAGEARYAARFRRAGADWTFSAVTAERADRGTVYRFVASTSKPRERKWLFGISPTANGCLLTLAETGTTALVSRVWHELALRGHHADIELFLRTWLKQVVPDQTVKLFSADRPEDLEALRKAQGMGGKKES